MRAAALLLTLAALGCRPHPGAPDYSSHVGLRDVPEEVEFLPGAVPFVDGVPRLSLGVFYEGDATNEILINDFDTHYYIFEQTYSIEKSGDRVEGVASDLHTATGGFFFGGGVVYDTPRDLSDWTTLRISLKSSDPTFAALRVLFLSGEGRAESGVDAADYGFVNDGEWHHLAIPLREVPGLDLSLTASPLILSASTNTPGDQLLVDDVYYSQE